MSIHREQAWSLLCEWTEGESRRKHARAVEIVMRAVAELGEHITFVIESLRPYAAELGIEGKAA